MEEALLVAQVRARSERRPLDGARRGESTHRTNWVWTKGHTTHDDNNRCDWLAQNAAATQTSSWPDGRRHAPLQFNPGAPYVPPRPQADLFGEVDDEADDE